MTEILYFVHHHRLKRRLFMAGQLLIFPHFPFHLETVAVQTYENRGSWKWNYG